MRMFLGWFVILIFAGSQSAFSNSFFTCKYKVSRMDQLGTVVGEETVQLVPNYTDHSSVTAEIGNTAGYISYYPSNTGEGEGSLLLNLSGNSASIKVYLPFPKVELNSSNALISRSLTCETMLTQEVRYNLV